MNQKLYRSRTDKMVGGVCGGLGRYLRIDPLIVRLCFVLLTVFGGFGAPVYLVMWIIIPYESEEQPGSAEAARPGADELAQRARMMADDVRQAVRMPNPQAAIIVGAALIFFGLLALLRNLDLPWLFWLRFDVLWPALLILGGAVLIWRRFRA